MEFDIINDLISDTIGRFFSTSSQVLVIEDFRGIFSSQQIKKSNVSSSLTSLNSQNLQISSSQSSKNIETSPFIQKQTQVLSQNHQISNQQLNQLKSQSSSQSLSQQSLSHSSSNQASTNTSLHSQQIQQQNIQRNNLFEQNKEPLTPELWIQKEGPNKLREAQQRLNLNLSRVSRSDLENMTLDQLTSEKKKVKQELKMYDASFQTHFNRFPVNQELKKCDKLIYFNLKLTAKE